MEETDVDSELQEYLNGILPEVRRRALKEPMLFTNSLVIPSANGPKLFVDIMQSFQRETFEALFPSLQAVCNWKMPPTRRFWVERTKKASKDSDIAVCILWMMAFSPRPLKIQISAANRKQAGIIENRVIELLHYNPWLSDIVEVIDGCIRNRIKYREVWTHIEATDATGAAHGETPDVLVLNELVHVAKWRAMEDHMANADGVPQGVVIVATNAGVKGTKAWTWRKTAIESNRWFKNMWSTPAPWIAKEDVDEAKERDPVGAEFARLWYGKWISGTGDAISDEDIDACFTEDGPQEKPERGWEYLAGLDLGVSKDHAGIAVVGVNTQQQKIRVARVRGFAPSAIYPTRRKEVSSDQVESYCERMHKVYKINWFGYDPAQGGTFMAQRLRKRGLPMVEAKFNSTSFQTAMVTALVQAVKEKHLQAYEDEEGRLRRDLGKFSIERKGIRGYKLIAVSDEHGHADVGVALALILPTAMSKMKAWKMLLPDDEIASEKDNSDPLTDLEVDEMPEELRDIYKTDYEDRE